MIDFKTATELMELIEKYNGQTIYVIGSSERIPVPYRIIGVSLDSDDEGNLNQVPCLIGMMREGIHCLTIPLRPSIIFDTLDIAQAQIEFLEEHDRQVPSDRPLSAPFKGQKVYQTCSNCFHYTDSQCHYYPRNPKGMMSENTCENWRAK